jgi:tetratricopeptide (TPR) repeat protein
MLRLLIVVLLIDHVLKSTFGTPPATEHGHGNSQYETTGGKPVMNAGSNETEAQRIANDELLAVGRQHFDAGQTEQAESICNQVLQSDPNQPIALHLLGLVARRMDRNDIAVEHFTKAVAIFPNYAEAHNNLAITHQVMGNLDEAVASYDKTLAFNPDNAGVHYNLGIALSNLGKPDEAITSYGRALALNPNNAGAHYNLGIEFQGVERLEEAVASYRHSLAIDPNNAGAHYNLANALMGLKKMEEAEVSYNSALAINPDNAWAHINLGIVLQGQGKFDKAVASYRKGIDIAPDNVEGHFNIGCALQESGRLDEAMDFFERALTLNPNHPDVHQNHGLALLAVGNIKEGLENLEWRFQVRNNPTKLIYSSHPVWDGTEDLQGQSILLWAEQGIGDTVKWVSRLSQVTAQAKDCILEVQPKLVSLMARSFPNVEVRAKDGPGETTTADFNLPLGSLFHRLYPDIETPDKTYLIPAPERVTYWKDRLAELGPGPYIGISWKSSMMNAARAPHFTQIEEWGPVFSNQEAVFVNLQTGDFENDLVTAQRDFGVQVHNFENLDMYNDLDDVAALSAALDVAISVTTVAATITAGVGTPTWHLAIRQGIADSVLHRLRGPAVESFMRDYDESWQKAIAAVAERLRSGISNSNSY